MREFTFIDLFAGIGGFSLGLERAGMKCVAQVEIDPFCNQVLAKHWPHVKRIQDVKKAGKHNLPTADLICGGFPCQPHSLAGQRRGPEDDRDLWPEYRRIIAEIRPTWVVAENVPGIHTTILSTSPPKVESRATVRTEGQDYFSRIYLQQENLYLNSIIQDLEDLGYIAETLEIPACAFDAKHIRSRIFIIAHTQSSTRNLSDSAWQQEKELHPRGDGATQFMANAASERLERENAKRNSRTRGRALQRAERNWWPTEPNVGRVAHGVPDRVDRLKSLGNAVVPQVVEFLARAILSVEVQLTPPSSPSQTQRSPR